ncbi:MAG: hypothetical protein LBL66_01855 [Clostridiales bacterium]|jgi:hypothetical protein|nr:hypothetical protein [Clostridiales bacterium]
MVLAAAALALALALALAGAPPAAVTRAGAAGQTIADNTLFSGGEVDYANWRYEENAGITAARRGDSYVARFGGTTDGGGLDWRLGNPLISRKKAAVSSVGDVLTASFTLRLINVGAGKCFGFVFGLPSVFGDAGSDGAYFLYFENQGGYRCGLIRYVDGGETVIAPPAPLPPNVGTGIGADDFTAEVSAGASGALNVSIAGETLYAGTVAGAEFSGYIGFAQAGDETTVGKTVYAELSDISAYNKFYDRPETPAVVSENFDAGDFDTNLWRFADNSSGLYGGVYAGGGKLYFDRAPAGANFGTAYKYSNFDLAFTLSDFQNTAESDPKARGGIRAACGPLIITFGVDSAAAPTWFWSALVTGYSLQIGTAIDMQTGARTGKTSFALYRGLRTGTEVVARAELPAKYDMYNGADDARYECGIAVTDGHFSVGLRVGGETAYTEVLSAELPGGETTAGYITFWAYANNPATNPYFTLTQTAQFSLDDVVLRNTDESARTVAPPPRSSSKIDPLGDAPYTDAYDAGDLLQNRLGEKDGGGCAGKTAAFGGAAVLAVCFIFVRRRGI